MKTKIFLALTLFSILTMAVFRQTIFLSLAEWQFNSYLSKHLDQPLEYDEFKLQDGDIVITGISAKGQFPGGHNDYTVSVKEIALDYTVDPLHWDFFAKAIIKNPVIQIFKRANQSFALEGSLTHYSPAKFPLKILCKGGKLILKDLQHNEEEHIIYFDYDDSDIDNKITRINLFLDPEQRSEQRLDVSLVRKKEQFESSVQVRNFSASQAFKFLSFFSQGRLSKWDLQEGLLNSKVKAVLSHKGEITSFDANATVDSCRIVNKALDLKGSSDKVLLELSTVPGAAPLGPKKGPLLHQLISSFQGKVSLAEGSSLSHASHNKDDWELKNIQGHISLHKNSPAKLLLQAVLHQYRQFSPMIIEGEAYTDKNRNTLVKSTLDLLSDDQDNITLLFQLKEDPQLKRTTSFHLNNFGTRELTILQNLMKIPFPDIDAIKLLKGQVSANIEIESYSSVPKNLNIYDLLCRDVELQLPSSQALLSLSSVEGSCSLDLTALHPPSTLMGSFNLRHGELSLDMGRDNNIHISDINGALNIKKGMFYASRLSSSLGLISADFDINWFNPKEMLKCRFTGDIANIPPYLPEKIRNSLNNTIGDEKFELSASLAREQGIFHVTGDLAIGEKAPDLNKLLDFSFDIEKAAQGLWGRWLVDNEDSDEWLSLYQNTKETLLPKSLLPAQQLSTSWLSTEKGFSGLLLKNGRFTASDIRLENYVSPFIFYRGQISLTGSVDAVGSFDGQHVYVEYRPKNLNLDHQAFNIKAKSNSDHAIAYHYFDLQNLHHHGKINIIEGSFHDKKFNLPFKDIQASVLLTDNHVYIDSITAQSEGMSFEGLLDIDHSLDDEVKVNILTKRIYGSLPSLQNFLAHFGDNDFSDENITGGIVTTENGKGDFHFLVKPHDTEFHTTLYGSFKDGTYSSKNESLHLTQLEGDIFYNEKDRSTQLSNIKGLVNTPNSPNDENYHLVSSQLHISNLPSYKVDFDFSIHNRENEEVVSLSGDASKDRDNNLDVNFNSEKTHIGTITPNISSMTLENLEEVLHLEAEPTLRLSTLFDDLQHLANFDILPLPRDYIGVYDETKLYGELDSKLSYDKDNELYHFSALGEDLIVGTKMLHSFFLNGDYSKKNGKWNIQQLQADKMSLSAELTKESNYWNIPYLGLRYGKAFVLALEGKLFDRQHRLESTITLLECDLDNINDIPLLPDYIGPWNTKGNMEASGDVTIQYNSENSTWSYDIDSQLEFDDLELDGAKLRFHEPLSCLFSDSGDLQAQNIKLSFSQDDKASDVPALELEEVKFLKSQDSWSLKDIAFSLSEGEMKEALKSIKKLFPAYRDEINRVAPVLIGSRPEEKVQGTATALITATGNTLHFALDDGEYLFGDRKHNLKNVKVSYHPSLLQVTGEYYHEGEDYWLRLETDPRSIRNGKLYISEEIPKETLNTDSMLTVLWERNETGKVKIESINGNFAGLNIAVEGSKNPLDNDDLIVNGIVTLDLNTAIKLVPENLKVMLNKVKAGKGFAFNGLFTISPYDFALKNFNGLVTGKNFEFLGKKLQYFKADMEFLGDEVAIHKLELKDMALTLHSEDILLYKDAQDTWRFNIPLATAQNIRPSMLKEDFTKYRSRPLIINYGELRNLVGALHDIDSFRGEGYIKFRNPAKKNIFKILFAIPNDLIARIGLDFNLLTPVSGTIRYELQGQKILLKQLKDVYSEGRRSKFYLSQESGISYMDLDGNLDIKLRMKQFNIIFKIAEMFTISIGGTLDKPTYTLKKQVAKRPKLKKDGFF